MYAFLLGLVACSLKDKSPGSSTDDSGGNGGYPSDFSSGKYQWTAFTILGDGAGRDWNDDGQPDNNLPNVLETFAILLPDLSKTNLNDVAADAIQNDELVLLADANFDGGELTLDFLAGLLDEDGGLVVDEATSYKDGVPVSRLVGTFTSDDEYTAGPDPMLLALPVTAGGDLAPIPLEEVTMQGELGTVTLDGTFSGIVPVVSFVAGVLPVFVPAEGFDMNGDGEIGSGETQAELIDLATLLLDTGADVVTEDGEPGISAAFHFAAAAADF
jgi:hypothetical protein